MQLRLLLSAKWRAANLDAATSAAVRAAFDGNGNAQFHPWKGWRFSGFGVTNHLRGTECALNVTIAARRVLAEVPQTCCTRTRAHAHTHGVMGGARCRRARSDGRGYAAPAVEAAIN